MKINQLTTLTGSALLSALMMTPICGNAAVTVMNAPVAAQKALQAAMAGLDSAGWPSASAATSVSQPLPKAAVQAAAKKTPPTNEELIARLVILTRSFDITGGVNGNICRVLELCDGTKDLPLKTAVADTATDGATHTFGVPLPADSKDILIFREVGTNIEFFLTDKTLKLRAAGISQNGVPHLIVTEKGLEQFKKEVALFARESVDLPPTTPGNS